MDKNELIIKLQEYKKQVSKKYGVKKIILFGSYSKDLATEESDVDLIIIGDFESKGNLQRAPIFYKEWHLVHNIDLPVDIICYTSEEFNKLKNQITIVKEAVEEGMEI